MQRQRRCGAVGTSGGSGTWRGWGPPGGRAGLGLLDDGRRRVCPMEPEDQGYFRHTEADVPEGQRYAYSLDGGPDRPDPCSLWQPDGVHGPSAVVRPGRFAWADGDWRGVRREDLAF